jgi:3-oxoacyl-[acyl-carrier-protein] synthase II
VIRAVAWFCAEHHGVFAPRGKSWQRTSPELSVSANAFELIGRPVNYFPRMTTEARFCLCAASMALKTTAWQQSRDAEIGIISAGAEGCLAANQQYFRDYVACGRTLGRGNLFIYTLPTSVLGEVAIVLSLTGPSIFIHDDVRPLSALDKQAERLVADGEAAGILALWSDRKAAVCMAVDAGTGNENISKLLANSEASPLQLASGFQLMVQRS